MNVPEDLKIRLAISVVLGALFSVILAAAAHGRLLYGADLAGIYNPGDFLYRPNVDSALPSLVALLTGSNPYATFYVSLALEAAVAAYCAQLLAYHFAKVRYHGLQLWGVQFACAALYLGNPSILAFGTQSLLSNVLISTDALLAFFAIVIEIVRDFNRGRPLSRWTAIWLGLAIGLSAPQSFPNLLRYQVLILLSLLAVAAFLIVKYGPWARRIPGGERVPTRSLGRFALYCLPIAAVLLAYPLWIAATQYLFQKGLVDSIIASQPTLAAVQYNTFPFVIRLIGKPTFHNLPYSAGYQQFTLQAFASWLWPLVALGVPLVATLVDRPNFVEWRWVVVTECVAWLSIAWGGGSNPPFGSIVGTFTGLPRAQAAFPLYFPQFEPLSWLYALLASVSIIWIGRKLHDAIVVRTSTRVPSTSDAGARTTGSRGPTSRRSTQAKVAAAAFVLIVVTLLLCADTPVVTGQSLVSRANLPSGGFVIPGEYGELRNVLTRAGGTTVVLPGIGSNFQTSWNYYGDSSFYPLYLYPAKVVTPAYYGPFGILKTSNAESYSNLTSPLVPGTSANVSSPLVTTPKVVASAATLAFTWKTRNASVSWSGSQWLGFTLTSNQTGALDEAIVAGTLWAAVLSESGNSTKQQMANFQVGGSYASIATNSSDSVQVSLFLPFSASGTLTLGKVVGVKVWFESPVPGGQPSLSLSGFSLYRNSDVSAGWVSLASQYDLKFVLLDTTIFHGELQPMNYARDSVAAMERTNVAEPYWSSTDLQLLEL